VTPPPPSPSLLSSVCTRRYAAEAERGSASREHQLREVEESYQEAGNQFTCFTSTKAQIRRRICGAARRGSASCARWRSRITSQVLRFTWFASTGVQILTHTLPGQWRPRSCGSPKCASSSTKLSFESASWLLRLYMLYINEHTLDDETYTTYKYIIIYTIYSLCVCVQQRDIRGKRAASSSAPDSQQET